MIVFKLIRTFLAVLSALFLTLFAVLVILVLGPPTWLICACGKWKNPIELVPAYWGHAVTTITFRFIMGARVKVIEDLQLTDLDRPTIIMANHPALLATPLFVSAIARTVGPRLVAVGRYELLYIPPVGWPLWIINGCIFIRRDRRHDALDELRKKLPSALANGAAVYIFPDKHRPTRKAITRDRKYYKERLPVVLRWRFTPVPRSGGLCELLKTAGPRVRVINVSSAFSVYDGDWWRPDVLAGAMHRTVISDRLPHLSTDQAVLGQWLVSEWAQKNRRFRRWKTE